MKEQVFLVLLAQHCRRDAQSVIDRAMRNRLIEVASEFDNLAAALELELKHRHPQRA